jgi:hypothetical protein
VVVNEFDIMSITVPPAETDPPLIVDANTVLPGAVATELLEPVAGRSPKVVKRFRSIMNNQLPKHYASEDRRIAPNRLSREHALRVAVRKAPDHDE